MVYKIMWWKDARVIGARVWDDLPGAIEYAKQHFPVWKHQELSTSVEVVDETEKVVFKLEGDGTLH